jgi:SAM-dependent methyltransferase
MSELINVLTPLHKKTTRDYLARMKNQKAACMAISKEYGYDYWDGDRKFGYGGYEYIPGRFTEAAKSLINRYGLNSTSKILDVGCGKGYMLYELSLLIPGATLHGIDISNYAIEHSKIEIQPYLKVQSAADRYPFKSNEFDFVFSSAVLHNLKISDLKNALHEIERVGKSKYIMVESFRNDLELFNLQCWALTAKAFFDTDDWIWLFKEFGYTGDYEFIFFE